MTSHSDQPPPIHVRLPAACPACPACGEGGAVALETNVSGAIVQLLWWCRRCNASWSVKRRDEDAQTKNV